MRKDRIIYSTGSFSLTLALTAVITVALCANPFAGFYVMVGGLFFFPFFLQIVLRAAGPGSALASLALFGFGVGIRLGTGPALFVCAYLLVPLTVYGWCLYKNLPAAKSMPAIALAYALWVLALYALSFRILGDAPFEALSRMAVESLNTMPQRDGLLSAAYSYGLLGLPEEIAEVAVIQVPQGGATFSPEALAEFFKQIHTRASLWLRVLVPSLISSLGPYLALGGVYMSDYYGKRQAQRRIFRMPEESRAASYAPPELKGLAPFHQWYIPKHLATPLWIMGGVSLLTRLSGQEALSLAGAMLYNIFTACFAIQGISLVNFMQRQRGVRSAMRGITTFILALILPQAAMILGMFDQISDQRKLRKPNESNGSDTGRDES